MMAPGSYSVISVKDNGLGMDAETQAHIFEPFFTTKEMGKGTGLGLSTVCRSVKQHKGMVWVYSEVGLGTEFKIYPPSCRGDEDRSAASSSPIEVAGGSETIVIVEDEVSQRLRAPLDAFCRNL
jgi:hypothetical protein